MIDHLTKCSLFLEFYLTEGAEKPLAIGTGFTFKPNDKNDWFLVTNWHCVTGRHADTKEPLSDLADPEIMKVYFHKKGCIGEWIVKEIRLLYDGVKQWFEHTDGNAVDIAVLKLEESEDIQFFNLGEVINGNNLLTYPSDDCSIIGYPKGLTSGGKFPIWKTGHIASDFDLNWDDKPLFYIDATTRVGMSGSPVVCIKEGLCHFDNHSIASGRYIKFLGVYSGRVDNTTEIGQVWKPQALLDILNDYYQH